MFIINLLLLLRPNDFAPLLNTTFCHIIDLNTTILISFEYKQASLRKCALILVNFTNMVLRIIKFQGSKAGPSKLVNCSYLCSKITYESAICRVGQSVFYVKN